MANVDRPNGFKAVKTLSGAPVSSVIRSIGVGDGEDMFIGDAINLASGLGAVGDTNDAAFLGVAVGFGKANDMTGEVGGMFNADSPGTFYYDDSANTNTDWVVFYVPVGDVVFEAQTATALNLAVGATCDLLGTSGDILSGQSRQEITTSSNADFTVVEIPKYVDNDNTAVWGRYWVVVTNAEQAFI